MEANVVILSPHLDDAVFSCWHLLDSEHDVSVVNVFAGVPPAGTPLPRWDRITGARDPVERVRDRLKEDRAALALAGRKATNLRLVEAQYRRSRPTLEEVFPPIRMRLAGGQRLVAPAGIGGHSAHRLVRAAAFLLAAEGFPVSFFADVPYATEFGWPAWATGAGRDALLDVDSAWSEDVEPLLEAGYEPRAVTLDEDAQRRKVEAMRRYKTQFAALEAGGQRRLTHPDLVRCEVVWVPRGS
jgi:LmbE family N-acetylglucosaminyl deacetylase